MQPILKTFILSHFYRLYLKNLSIECHWNSRQRKHRSDERSALPDRSVSFEWLPDWWRIKLKSTKVEAFKELWLKYCSVASRWFMDFQKLISENIASVKVLLVLHNAKRDNFISSFLVNLFFLFMEQTFVSQFCKILASNGGNRFLDKLLFYGVRREILQWQHP